MPLQKVIDGVTYLIPQPHEKTWGVNGTALLNGIGDAVNGRLRLIGGTLTGPLVLAGAPTLSLHPASKAYVDASMLGLRVHTECRLATTANVNLASALANGQTLDGVVIATGDRILVKNQTSALENGVYVAPVAGAASRATDGDTYAELFQGFFSILAGTANANTGWLSQTTNTGTIGVDAVSFARFSTSGPVGTAAALDAGAADANLPTNALLKGTVRAFTKQQTFARSALTDAATIAWDLDTQQIAKVTLGGNRTLGNPSNMKDGGTYIVRVYQDGTGGRALTYGSAYRWVNGIVPVLGVAPGSWTTLTFECDGTLMGGAATGPFIP